jgi:hypothetical protein
MQGLNMELGIDFGFKSSRFCKFKGISREHGGKSCFFFLLLQIIHCTHWAMMDGWLVVKETVFGWIQLS